jgi:hypothetical protein
VKDSHTDKLPRNNSVVSRTVICICVCLFTFFFTVVYVNWASPRFHYFGLTFSGQTDLVYISLGASLIVAAILPIEIKRYSSFIVWMLYYITYLPTVLTLALQGIGESSKISMIFAISISFASIVLVARIMTARPVQLYSSQLRQKFFIVFSIVYTGSYCFYIYTFYSVFNFAGLDFVYEQRHRYVDAGAGAMASYVTVWIANVLNPFVTGLALFERGKRWLFMLAIAGQSLAYMSIALRSTLAGFLLMILLWRFAIVKGQISVIRLSFGVSFLMATTWLAISLSEYGLSERYSDIITLVYFRTFAIQGAMTGVYANFFADNPLTYYSHVNFVNVFIYEYPYGNTPLGVVIGQYLVGGKGFNANAPFWATDGIAAAGVGGILLIGVVFGLILTQLDRLIPPDKVTFASIVSAPFVISLANASLFTSLVTGGGILIVICIALGGPISSRSIKS